VVSLTIYLELKSLFYNSPFVAHSNGIKPPTNFKKSSHRGYLGNYQRYADTSETIKDRLISRKLSKIEQISRKLSKIEKISETIKDREYRKLSKIENWILRFRFRSLVSSASLIREYAIAQVPSASLSREYAIVTRICHAHSNAHKPAKTVAPTVLMLEQKFY